MNRRTLFIILAVILFIATGVAVAFILLGDGLAGLTGGATAPEPSNEQPMQGAVDEPQIETVQVIVALQPIPRGSEFVEGSIGRRDWPADNVPPDVIADEAETIGKVAKTEIVQGQVIVRSMLVDLGEGGEASFQVETGHVGIAYPINRQTSVAYAVQPGDYVDILVTSEFVDVDPEFQTPLPNKVQFFFPSRDADGETQSFRLSEELPYGRVEQPIDLQQMVFSDGSPIPRRVAQLTVPSAKVIKVGPWREAPLPPPPEAQEGEPQPAPQPDLPDIVTLSVEPQDALVLLWLRQSGIYNEMVLRAAGDEDSEHRTEAVTLQYMLTRFDIAVPPKIEFIMSPSELERLEQLRRFATERGLNPDQVADDVQQGR